MTKQLHNASTGSIFKNLNIVKNGTHNDTWLVGGREYLQELVDFINTS